MKRALLFWGGWDGHQPEKVVHLFATELEARGFSVQIESSLDCLLDVEALKQFALIFPCWTMGTLTGEQGKALQAAVKSGVGLGGIHGGMGDAFRGNLDYEWMVGGNFLGHPHVGDYTVQITDASHPITAGVPAEFAYTSEQYYMMTDPGNHVLATAPYTYEGRTVTMPVAWTKHWGAGRVFYCALGHSPEEFAKFPAALQLTMQGLLWAAGS